MISYPIGNSGQHLVIDNAVLEHFKVHQQNGWWSREAGGQLFAQEIPSLNQLRIVLATGPRLTDKRTRTTYHPDRHVEQQEIDAQHALGLHFVGDWHTHPEYQPSPSISDERSIASGYKESKHQLNAFVLIIVGRGNLSENMYVGLYDTCNVVSLEPTSV